ncbi:HNH endonuclease (plasmid) [Azospirillum humicireducens]|uniref:HNH endonuclease n=1 Tax=Azospirillum humicireducens TaxID=1226968 RepID=A0A2R4VVW3_9PROT|nr:HNH endonuclease [Azospirillum humicireducens]AWB08590.1 HNH endonuclease [Azospirillum humicireducens]
MPVTPDDATLMDVQQGGRCFFCDGPVGAKATVDHLIPQAYGGIDGPANAVLAHRRCNQRKGDRLPTGEELDRFFALRRSSRLGVWPPLQALREVADWSGDTERWMAVAQAIARER